MKKQETLSYEKVDIMDCSWTSGKKAPFNTFQACLEQGTLMLRVLYLIGKLISARTDSTNNGNQK